MRFKILLLSILLSTNYAFSQESLTSDFYFPIDQKVINKMLKTRAEGLTKNPLDDVEVFQPYRTSVNGINLSFEYAYELQPSDEAGVQAQFAAIVKNLKVSIDKVSTRDQVQEQVGSIFLDIAIQGDCNDVLLDLPQQQIELNGDMIFSAPHKQRPKLSVELQPFTIPQNWQFSVNSCQGPAGYEDGVRGAIESFVASNQDTLKTMVQEEVNEIANRTLDDLLDRVMQQQVIDISEDMSVVFNPTGINFSEFHQVFLLQGAVITVLPGPSKSVVNHIPFDWDVDKQSSVKSGLIVSQSYIASIIDGLYRANQLTMSLNSQDNPSFKRLQRSRFLQFFVFPDLMKFSKKANFLLNASLKSSPKTEFYAQSGRFTWFDLQANIKIDMLAPQKQGHIPYMHYKMPATAKLWMTVHKKQLVVGASEVNSQFKAFWNKEYLKQYKTNRRFASGVFKSGFEEALEAERFKIDLPRIELEGVQTMVPSALQSNEDWIQLAFDVETHQK